ncbi:MAG TPA: isoleucine--tRNA ligase [Elusimicrobiales bacterium]|nr:isoleucine--tRNA ligase [Elusimicrobiales bacterium]
MSKEKVSYSKTVLLPKTDFPMRANLPNREPLILEFWNKINLYEKMLKAREGKDTFILHDGPPYANGHIHIGTAFNKILKDITVKSRAMMGLWSPYVPGWDCHGLPIEFALMKEMKIHKRHIEDVPAFRQKAREFAGKFIDIQRSEFKRLGGVGDWENPYITMSPKYEGAVMDGFLNLFEKGYIYRGKKSVLWCISCETALADAETEYKDKTSHSIYVKFAIDNPPKEIFKNVSKEKISIVIWTTTPWTLPANRACAVSQEEKYRLLKDKKTNQYYVVADKLSDSFMSACKLECEKKELILGEKLVGLKYRHPIFSEQLAPVIYTDFVDMETGTGVVHIAPSHGEDDFYAGLKWKLDIFCPVDHCGKFTSEGGEFEGLTVFDANDKVIEKLKNESKLLGHGKIEHSYPHCWRCKKPVIFRAAEQWFLNIDHQDLRKKLIKETDNVSWIPSVSQERLKAMLKNRPDWCLSRQRYWGTPVPVIYCDKCNEIQKDKKLFDAIRQRAYKEGSDFWFTDKTENIVPPNYKCKCGSNEFRKETDILDVWMDSGMSWMTLKEKGAADKKQYPCDLYLEGSDQHRGWFQTSLICSTAINGYAPYKAVLTHGFTLDEVGKAMHKSAGNVVAPEKIIKKYGAEIIRLWATLSDYSDDVRISDTLLQGPIDIYRKMRNTVRYMIATLYDYEPANHKVPDDNLLEVDKYIKGKLSTLVCGVEKDYADFKYRQAMRKVADFCILDLSAFYFDSLKDRLYTLGRNSLERRSAQTVIYEILRAVLKLASPVLSFTSEEAWQEFRKIPAGTDLKESVFLEDFKENFDEYKTNASLKEKWNKILEIRTKILKELEVSRQKGDIGSSLEAMVIFKTSDSETLKFLENTLSLWPSITIVSQVKIAKEGAKELEIEVRRAEGTKCPRCWQWKTDIGSSEKYPDLCERCANVMSKEKI